MASQTYLSYPSFGVCQHRHPCVEPEASVVDASAVWHGTASVPGGRFWHTLQLLDAADWRAIEYRVAVVRLVRIRLQASVCARSVDIGVVYGRWLLRMA